MSLTQSGEGTEAKQMTFFYRAAAVALLTFLCSLAGIIMQHVLPGSDVSDAQTMTGHVVVLVGSMLSVVLGLLVWHSHGLFNDQQSKLHALASTITHLNFILIRIGPEAAPARALLREQARDVRKRFWPATGRAGLWSVPYEEARADVHAIRDTIETLRPANEEQRLNLSVARDLFGILVETKVSMTQALASRVSGLLISVLLGWACAMFLGYGLLSTPSVLTVFMAAIGSLAVGSALFLILELADPFSGLFRIPSNLIDTVIDALQDTAEADSAPMERNSGARIGLSSNGRNDCTGL